MFTKKIYGGFEHDFLYRKELKNLEQNSPTWCMECHVRYFAEKTGEGDIGYVQHTLCSGFSANIGEIPY